MIERHAHGVFRGQPFHRGHTAVMNLMNESFNTWSVGLGSTGRQNEPSNPWTQVDRQQMLRNIYGNRVRIIPLQDLGAEQGANTWCEYVLSKAEGMKLPPITDYFTGSHADAMWYKGMFWDGDPNAKILATKEYEEKYFTKDGILRRLHMIDRANNEFPSATEIRTFLATRSDEWKRWVPAINHDFIERTYPEAFKVKLNSSQFVPNNNSPEYEALSPHDKWLYDSGK
jgi:hypothetical protein